MEQLIAIQKISVGDLIQFVFKKNQIQGRVGHGGHILNTIIYSSEEKEIKSLYTRTYPSLTAWSEACLREGLQEENTRYASWKRVIHVPSGKTLQSLRSTLNVAMKMSAASRQDLFSEINRLRQELVTAKQGVLTPRPSASVTDDLLMTPSVVEFFKQWAATSLHRG
jgi:hypothetical protein